MDRARVASLFSLAALALAPACANAPTPLEAQGPRPKSPIATRTEAELDEIAKFARKTRGRVILAPAEEGAERPSLAFSFQVLPPRPETAPALRDGALLGATVDADGRGWIVAVRKAGTKITITEEDEAGAHEASYDKVQVLLARRREEASSHDARLHAARVFGLDATRLEGRYAGATLTAFVLATRLVKTSVPPAFRSPGEGSWTLLRIVGPGEGYLGIDWDAGRGELFPKAKDGGPLGEAVLHAL